jgi:hypothetical protein
MTDIDQFEGEKTCLSIKAAEIKDTVHPLSPKFTLNHHVPMNGQISRFLWFCQLCGRQQPEISAYPLSKCPIAESC